MDQKHFITPTKAKVQGTVKFLEAKGIPFFKEDVFCYFGIGHIRGWEML